MRQLNSIFELLINCFFVENEIKLLISIESGPNLCPIRSNSPKNPKTKEMVSFLSKLSLENVLIITDEIDKNLHLASRNIPHVNVVTTAEINPVMLLKPHKVAITPAAFKKIEELI